MCVCVAYVCTDIQKFVVGKFSLRFWKSLTQYSNIVKYYFNYYKREIIEINTFI